MIPSLKINENLSSNYFKIGNFLVVYGIVNVSCAASTTTFMPINFPEDFKDTNYSVVCSKSAVAYSTELYPTVGSKRTSSCTIQIFNSRAATVTNNLNYVVVGRFK